MPVDRLPDDRPAGRTPRRRGHGRHRRRPAHPGRLPGVPFEHEPLEPGARDLGLAAGTAQQRRLQPRRCASRGTLAAGLPRRQLREPERATTHRDGNQIEIPRRRRARHQHVEQLRQRRRRVQPAEPRHRDRGAAAGPDPGRRDRLAPIVAQALDVHVGDTVPIGFYTNEQTILPGYGTSAGFNAKPYRKMDMKVVGLVAFNGHRHRRLSRDHRHREHPVLAGSDPPVPLVLRHQRHDVPPAGPRQPRRLTGRGGDRPCGGSPASGKALFGVQPDVSAAEGAIRPESIAARCLRRHRRAGGPPHRGPGPEPPAPADGRGAAD